MTEQEMNDAAVTAYRESLKGRKPLSESKLAAMFGKTSQRPVPPHPPKDDSYRTPAWEPCLPVDLPNE
jgi:hypothetical protein